MPQYDLSAAELAAYRGSVTEPTGLAAFWEETLQASRARARAPRVEPVDARLPLVEVSDVTLSGYDGEPVRAWYRRPAGVGGDLPLVIRYQGYTGGRGLPHQVPHWTLAGYATLDVDSRGQGSGGGWVGDTPDPHGHGPSYLGGFMTRGLEDPARHYYRRLLTDAVLAVDAGVALPGVDRDRVVVAGVSQGGGIALAVSGLHDGLAGVLADVPFLCDMPRGVAIASAGPYLEVAAFLASHRDAADRAFATLAHFDAAVLGRRATAPALMSVALMDTVCPPSTVHAARNTYGGPSELVVYPWNDHEGGQFHQEAAQLEWLAKLLGGPTPGRG
ncbi:acetylxylan esterase [Nocardioides kribbensis]|uniref:Acetylxylan esterase n=1 Tax=Nocardioides kribbensis TaxID=305517 RepID=A0ABV1NYH4_9ACTN